MKTDIILAGVGGQGILSIAAALGSAALTNNLYMKQAETHGMSQRGGDVQSFMRISDRPIYSDLIAKGRADIILSVEPMEALRYLPYLREGGFVVTNSTPFINIPNYPEVEKVMSTLKSLPHQVIIDADTIAKESAGNVSLKLEKELVVSHLNSVLITVILDCFDRYSLCVLLDSHFRIGLFFYSKLAVRDFLTLANKSALQSALCVFGLEYSTRLFFNRSHDAQNVT